MVPHQVACNEEDVAGEARLGNDVRHAVGAEDLIAAQRGRDLLRAQLLEGLSCNFHGLFDVHCQLNAILQKKTISQGADMKFLKEDCSGLALSRAA